MTARIALYWNTLRYLKLVQVTGRLWFRFHRPVPDMRPAGPLRRAGDNWSAPACRPPSLRGPASCDFLNRTADIGSRDSWNDGRLDKLWLYNLHYFDDLNAARAATRAAWHRNLVSRWIAENAPGQGVGWEPYPTSLRIVNWIKWFLGGAEPERLWLDSLACQTRWLTGRLERHLLGNHLFSNAKALIFAGLFFEGAEADSWLARGLSIIDRELPEQILADGGQFERSPMYHALALEDFLDLINASTVYSRDPQLKSLLLPRMVLWKDYVLRMLRWLQVMCHPDGEISFFNDAASGIASAPSELRAYALRLGLQIADLEHDPIIHLPVSGYERMERGDAVMLVDTAMVGPDYLPGHAHADTLSFELSLGSHRVIVNSGTSLYGDTAERLRQRGTRAHSTVEINGEDSTEVWRGFRVARRAYPRDLRMRSDRGATVISCAHDGYERLQGRPVHRREWSLETGRLLVRDAISGSFSSAVARFHLHPAIAVVQSSPQQGRLRCAGRTIEWRITSGSASISPSTYHPQFGCVIPSHCLEVAMQKNECATEFIWD